MMNDIGQRLFAPTKEQQSCYLSIYLYSRDIIALLSERKENKVKEQPRITMVVQQ